MSDRPEDVETRAGHPPAVKVGGMRVTQRARSPGSEVPHDPENPQIPPKDKEEGDSQVHGVGGLQSQPKDLLVNKAAAVPITAKDLGLHEEEVRHTHDKGINQGLKNDKHAQFTPKEHAQANRHFNMEPRSHGSNH